MYLIKRTCSKILARPSKKMTEKQEDLEKGKSYGSRWKSPVSMTTFSKATNSFKLKDTFSRFQDPNKRNKDSGSSLKGDSSRPIIGLMSIPVMFSQTNNYFEEAAKLVTSSDDISADQSIHIHMAGAPGESEGCSLSNKHKQQIYKLLLQAQYRSHYENANSKQPTNGLNSSVSY